MRWNVFIYKEFSCIKTSAEEKLSAVLNVKKKSIERYFKDTQSQMLVFAGDMAVADAAEQFMRTFNQFSSENQFSKVDQLSQKHSLQKFYQEQFGKKYHTENNENVDTAKIINILNENEIALQNVYISENSNVLGSKHLLDSAKDKSSYSIAHTKYHSGIREFLEKFHLYDIFLVDYNSGQIVYTVYKELDFATNILTGPYANSNLAQVYKNAKLINDRDTIAIVDYQNYLPSYNAPASFIAAPIWKNKEKIGVAIFQLPIDQINLIMSERSGMGQTGETYLIGADQLLRSDSYVDKENYTVVNSFRKPHEYKINTETVRLASQKIGTHTGLNYKKHQVLSAYSPIDLLGLKWSIVSDITTNEAYASVYSLKYAVAVLALISAILIFVLAFSISSKISKKISDIAKKLSLSVDAMASSSDVASRSSTELSEAATEQAASLQETVSSIDEISSMVQRNADAANSSAEVSGRSTDAALRGKKTVETMITSIAQIASSNDDLLKSMQKSNEEISKIVTVISEIGDKTKVINDIVFQTKLLSFNASVEASRAGEHGKGFAVVAEEVGNLASMSGKAALEITEMLDKSIEQVSSIFESTKSTAEFLVKNGKEKIEIGTKTAKECGVSLDEILKNVNSVNELVKEIATASVEQATRC